VVTGFCGGFTTFSAFTQEGLQMLTQNKWLQFTGYLSASVIGGFLLTYLGYKLFN
jgi:CrcB protein